MVNILKIYSNKKILVIGPYPPPFGGVSVHIKRLKNLLVKNECQVEVFFKNEKENIFISCLKLFYILIFKNFNFIHFHGYFRGYIIITIIVKKIKNFRIIFTLHNSRLFEKKNKLELFLLDMFFSKLDKIILVSKHLKKDFIEHKIQFDNKFIIANAFLPPDETDENKIVSSYHIDLKKSLLMREPVIIANAWKICFYNNIDLYGLDMCVELIEKLKSEFPNISLIFALANENENTEYIAKINQSIVDKNLINNILFMTGQKELWPLYKRANLSIRPTVTDGDAVSIREALYFNCPVVASDVVPRPLGTIIFKSRNTDDLYLKVLGVLSNAKKM